MDIKKLLTNNCIEPAIITEINYRKQKIFNLDLTSNNKELKNVNISDPELCHAMIQEKLKSTNSVIALGGYLEDRVLYTTFDAFNLDEKRSIHLGIDLWTEAEHPVFSPLDATVYSCNNNEADGDYGPTIILEHQISGFKFYTLYGHLSLKSLNANFPGKKIKSGEHFAWIGNYPENGNWAPHLHFQIVIELNDSIGDYPGVCSKNDLEYFKNNCPNPNILLKCKDID